MCSRWIDASHDSRVIRTTLSGVSFSRTPGTVIEEAIDFEATFAGEHQVLFEYNYT